VYLKQLEQVVRGSDQVPSRIYVTLQQEAAQSSGFFDLTVHRLDDRLALGVDR
jgi:hypothetical protein